MALIEYLVIRVIPFLKSSSLRMERVLLLHLSTTKSTYMLQTPTNCVECVTSTTQPSNTLISLEIQCTCNLIQLIMNTYTSKWPMVHIFQWVHNCETSSGMMVIASLAGLFKECGRRKSIYQRKYCCSF
jgi:hypothetical protein